MKLTYGNTRLVLLTRKRAIKFARIRPLRCLFRIVLSPFSVKVRERALSKYGDDLFQRIINDLFAGIIANRNEYRYSNNFNDKRIMPTLKQFWYGLVVVQSRGLPVSSVEMNKIQLFYGYTIEPHADTTDPCDFCRKRKGGKILLIDYGREQTCRALEASLP